MALPVEGCAFISVKDHDKPAAIELAGVLADHGFRIVATDGTAAVLRSAGIDCQRINKVAQGQPHIVDMIKNEPVNLLHAAISASSTLAIGLLLTWICARLYRREGLLG